MIWTAGSRRSFLNSLMTAPLVTAVPGRQAPKPAVEKVDAGTGRGRQVITLPGGNPLHVKVSTEETGGALFMTEQPAGPRGSGPPKHFHEDVDEWFYCLEGVYVVEIGAERFRLGPGDSVLGPRRVPHAFAFDASGPGKLLVGFSLRGTWSASSATSRSAAPTSARARQPTRRRRVVSTASSTAGHR